MKEKNILREKIFAKRKEIESKHLIYENKVIIKNIEDILNSFVLSKKLDILDKQIEVGLYFPIKGEPNLLSLVKKTKRCFSIPKIYGKEMDFIKYNIKSRLDASGFCGIKEPLYGKKNFPKIIIVPALAYDLNGYRLGFGKGYYDKYFAKMIKSQNIIKIGVCFHEYLYEKIPNESHDIKMDYVITDKITIKL